MTLRRLSGNWTRTLALLWLANTIVARVGRGGGGSNIATPFGAEGSSPYPGRGKYQRGGGSGSLGRTARHGGPPEPNGQYLYKDEEEDDDEAPSYFERHGLVPPPRLSPGRRRARRRRRRAEGETEDEIFWSEPGPGDAQAAGVARDEADETLAEIDSIVLNAKRGMDASARLRHDLLWGLTPDGDNVFYDRRSYPLEYVWHNRTATNGKRRGVPVEMNINFHRVFDVDVVNSVMDLVVWFRLVWVDPRLAWDPVEYGGLNETWFWIGDGGAGGETSEIWTPDVELWNLETGLKGSLEDTYARVSSDGLVWWGRPGRLRPTCKFRGLSYFPFDKLTCTMEFGSWMHNGKYLWMEKVNGVGYTIGGSKTAGESYEEYSFAEEDPIQCYHHFYRYPSAPENDWPVLMYNVTVSRSWQPYARGYIATQVVLNLVGFSAFWLPPSCGERMSLSVTAMLAALASEIVVAASLPAAAEMTWFSKFSILSMTFAFVSLMECVLVLYFYYKKSEDMVPSWYAFAKEWYFVREARKGGREVGNEVRKRSSIIASRTTDFVTETTNTAVDVLFNGHDTTVKSAPSKDSHDDVPDDAKDKNGSGGDDARDQEWSSGGDGAGRARPSIFFDDDVKDPPSAKGKENRRLSVESAGSASRRTMALCDYESQSKLRTSIIAPRDADDFNDDEELENNLKWKVVAARIDDVARFWIPLSFIVALAVILVEVL